MAQSFRRRFAGRELEILHYIDDNGGNPIYLGVPEHFGAKGGISWGRYIDEIAQKFDFKFAPRDRKPIENSRPLDMQLD